MSKKNQAAEKPQACPFCGKRELGASSSGRHSLCRKCNRIVLRSRPYKPSGRKPA